VPSSNLDLVRSIYAAWERGDYRSADWAHPDIEFVKVDGPDPGTWHGVGEMGRAWFETLRVWEDFHNDVDEYRELDAEQVLVLTYFRARGKASGLEVGQTRSRGASLFRLSEGKVSGLVLYWYRDRAFADLGLTSDTDA
jgi:ketosteroid isomerase-like protein